MELLKRPSTWIIVILAALCFLQRCGRTVRGELSADNVVQCVVGTTTTATVGIFSQSTSWAGPDVESENIGALEVRGVPNKSRLIKAQTFKPGESLKIPSDSCTMSEILLGCEIPDFKVFDCKVDAEKKAQAAQARRAPGWLKLLKNEEKQRDVIDDAGRRLIVSDLLAFWTQVDDMAKSCKPTRSALPSPIAPRGGSGDKKPPKDPAATPPPTPPPVIPAGSATGVNWKQVCSGIDWGYCCMRESLRRGAHIAGVPGDQAKQIENFDQFLAKITGIGAPYNDALDAKVNWFRDDCIKSGG